PTFVEPAVFLADTGVEPVFDYFLGRGRAGIAARPKAPQVVSLPAHRQGGIDAALVRVHEVEQRSVQAVEPGLREVGEAVADLGCLALRGGRTGEGGELKAVQSGAELLESG